MRLLLAPLFPSIIVAATILAMLVALSIRRSHRLMFCLSLLGIAVAFFSSWLFRPSEAGQTSMLFAADSFGSFYTALLLSATFAVVLISFDYLEARPEEKEEYYVLLLGALLGATVVVAARHFVSFFLGLEVLSISLYPLIAYRRSSPAFTEAGLKYLVLSGVSSAFLLFGMALVYGATGSMDFSQIGVRLAQQTGERLLADGGMMLVVVGVGFKLGVVPFHMWTPDVYEGAPAPVTAFIATISKGSIFALLLRYFGGVGIADHHQLFAVFSIIAAASMFAGNLLALFQNNVKRLLAYSSIAHFGYLLVAFLSSGPLRLTAVTFYLVAYFVTTIGAFGVVTLASSEEKDAGRLDEYEGLINRRPWLGGVFALMLLSLAGMPLTAGFIGKIYVIAAGVGSLLSVLVVLLIVNSAISLFYYLRVVALLFRPSLSDVSLPVLPSLKGRLLMVVLSILLIWWGVYPVHLINIIERIGIGR